MARIANKDTIAYEPVGLVPGDDTVVRREVKAGAEIPDHYQLEDDGAADEMDPVRVGLGAAPPYYKTQLDPETGQVKEEHADTGDAEEGGAQPRRSSARGRKPSSESSAPKKASS